MRRKRKLIHNFCGGSFLMRQVVLINTKNIWSHNVVTLNISGAWFLQNLKWLFIRQKRRYMFGGKWGWVVITLVFPLWKCFLFFMLCFVAFFLSCFPIFNAANFKLISAVSYSSWNILQQCHPPLCLVFVFVFICKILR